MTEYFKNIWFAIFSTAVGMKITLRHLFTPSVTLHYPRCSARSCRIDRG
ncbi:MAG: hypothetical protein U0166_04535 [Acidobacteriota bacterium]